MKRAVIIGAADIGDYERIRNELKEEDYFIFCDGGLRHREALGVLPSLLVGDFDSIPVPELFRGDGNDRKFPEYIEPAAYGQEIRHTQTAEGTELILLPHMKDWTDTVYAADEAVRRGFRHVLLIGTSGGRPDHYFANISILYRMEMQNVEAWLLDDCSKMRVLTAGEDISEEDKGGTCADKRMRIDDSVRYFSLLAYDGPARGVTVEGALYPLHDAEITAEDPYAVSNEVPPLGEAEISVKNGKLLVILIY